MMWRKGMCTQEKEQSREGVKWQMQMLHLEKLSQAANGKRELKKEKWFEKDFLCLGYYGRLTYIKEKDKSFDYKDAFSIKYPYTKTNQPLYAEQLFSILSKEQDDENDPFIYEDENSPKPFLGVLLMNLAANPKENFENYRGKLRKGLKEEFEKGTDKARHIVKIFDSTNCADLCVVMRTDSLQSIYGMKKKIRDFNLGKKDGKGSRNSFQFTLYVAIEPVSVIVGKTNNLLLTEQVKEENKNHQIEIRLSCKQEVASKFKEYCKGQGSDKAMPITFKGAMGNGEYSLCMNYIDFAKIYPVYWKLKEGLYALSKDNGQEKDEAEKDGLSYILEKYAGKIEIIYERWNIELEEENTNFPEKSNRIDDLKKSDKICELMEKTVKELVLAEPGHSMLDVLKKDNPSFSEQRFREQVILLKDLLYTYNDLWHHKATRFKGRIFYAQVSALLAGIEQQKDMIKTGISIKEKEQAIAVFNNDLILYMNVMISGINNFNKLAQAVNQNVKNVPNYEMQSKVNVEKYIFAYTRYLMKICEGYNKCRLSNQRVFPIMAIDLSCEKIQAKTLFQSVYQQSKGYINITPFIVQCPNYQRFADIYQVLPMITHEISHCFRFVKREKRNEFMLKFLPSYMVRILAAKLLQKEFWKIDKQLADEKINFLCGAIEETLQEQMEMSLKSKLSEIHLRNFPQIYCGEMQKYLNLYNAERISEKKLYEVSYNILLRLYQLCNVVYVSPAGFSNNTEFEYILLNMVLDVLKQDEEKMKEWEKCLSEFSGDADIELLKDILHKCTSGNQVVISKDIIEVCLRAIILQLWNGYISLHNEIGEQVTHKRCSDCMEYIKVALIYSNTTWDKKKQQLCKELVALGVEKNHVMKLNNYVEEVAGYIDELRQQWMISSKTTIQIENLYHDAFSKKVHEKLFKKYKELLAEKENNRWLLLPKTQALFSSLGIMNSDYTQFGKRLMDAANNMDVSYVKKCVNDKIRLYEEVCADLGMCYTFGFDAFGYFAYSIYLDIKERELPQFTGQNMTGDRMSYVIRTLWKNESNEKKSKDFYKKKSKEFKEKINSYYKELKIFLEECDLGIVIPDRDIWDITIKEFESFLSEVRELFIYDKIFAERISDWNKKKKELLMHLKMLEWMCSINLQMHLDVEYKENLALENHLEEIYGNSKMNLLFKEIKEEETIKEIGKYFNEFQRTVAELRNGQYDIKKERMHYQNDFILKYSSKMQDTCSRLGRMEAQFCSREQWMAKEYCVKFLEK